MAESRLLGKRRGLSGREVWRALLSLTPVGFEAVAPAARPQMVAPGLMLFTGHFRNHGQGRLNVAAIDRNPDRRGNEGRKRGWFDILGDGLLDPGLRFVAKIAGRTIVPLTAVLVETVLPIAILIGPILPGRAVHSGLLRPFMLRPITVVISPILVDRL